MKKNAQNLLLFIFLGSIIDLYGAQTSVAPVAKMLRQWGTEIVPSIIQDTEELRTYANTAAKIQYARYTQASGGLSDEEALKRAIQESLKTAESPASTPSPVSRAVVPWSGLSLSGALREIGARVRPEQALASTDDIKELANLIRLNNVTEYQEWQFRDFQMIPVGNRLPARLPAFTVPFVKTLQQSGADCGFYAAYNAILFARQMPSDIFTNQKQYYFVQNEARDRIVQENRSKIPELRRRLALARTERDRDDITREIRRRAEVVMQSSYITSDDVGIILSDMEPSVAICGENPRSMIETFNQNRMDPHFIQTYAEVYAADELTRNLMLRIAEFQQAGADARLVIVVSSATVGARGHWIAVEFIKNDAGQILVRAADSAGQHQELAKNTVALACEPMIRDIAEAIRTLYPEEPAPLLPQFVQDFSLVDLSDSQPASSVPTLLPATPFNPAPLQSFLTAPVTEQPKAKKIPTPKPVAQPSTSMPSSSIGFSAVPDLQKWWMQAANSRAAFVLPFYRDSSGQRIFILGREAHGSDRGTYSPFGGKWEPKDKTPAAGAAREFHEESGISLKDAQTCVSRASVFAVNTTNDTSRPRHLVAFYIVELTPAEIQNLRTSFATRRDREMDQLGEIAEKTLVPALSSMKKHTDTPSVQTITGSSVPLRNIFFRVKNYLRNPRAGIAGPDGVRFQDSHLK